MTRTLRISPDLSLPVGAVTQKFAVLGNSGSGKTYGAGKLVEELHDAGAQVVVVDTVGNWYGLRLAVDGKRPGLAIPILGGERGDVALEPHAGKLAAETVAETKASMILDVSDFIQADLRRFVIDFATALLALKKRAKSPVMVVWEECQDIVPQRVMGEDARMVGAVQRLIKKGRNYGVGTTLISQRPAAVNKDVLNLIETLLAFRTLGTSDRKQISDWVVSHAKQAEDLVDDLASLPTGTCFCWSPVWLGIFEKIRIGKKRTFDASATPEFGEEVVAGTLAPVDLDRFKKRMADAVEKAKAADPAELRKRIAELERQLRAKPAAAAAAAPAAAKVEVRTVEKPVIKPAELQRLEAALGKVDLVEGKMTEAVRQLGEQLVSVTQALRTLQAAAAAPPATVPLLQRPPAPRHPNATYAKADPNGVTHRASVGDRRSTSAAGGELPKGEAATLGALIQFPAGVEREQLSVLTGYKRRTRDTYLQRLGERGYVDKDGDKMIATDAGRAALPDWKPLPTGPALQEYWLDRLPKGEAAILRILIGTYPEPIRREALDESTGFSRRTRDSYLQRMAAKMVVADAGRGEVKASANLFEAPRG